MLHFNMSLIAFVTCIPSNRQRICYYVLASTGFSEQKKSWQGYIGAITLVLNNSLQCFICNNIKVSI